MCRPPVSMISPTPPPPVARHDSAPQGTSRPPITSKQKTTPSHGDWKATELPAPEVSSCKCGWDPLACLLQPGAPKCPVTTLRPTA